MKCRIGNFSRAYSRTVYGKRGKRGSRPAKVGWIIASYVISQ